MTLQQLESEVEERTHLAMLTRLIEREQAKLREVPAGETYEEYVRLALYEYVQAKLKAHRIKKKGDRLCESSNVPDREWVKLWERWHWYLVDANDLVKETRARYYRAIGRKQRQNG